MNSQIGGEVNTFLGGYQPQSKKNTKTFGQNKSHSCNSDDGLFIPIYSNLISPSVHKSVRNSLTKTQLNLSISAYCGLPSVRFVLLTFSNMSNCWLSNVHLLITLKNFHFGDVSCGCFRLQSHSL